MSGAAFMRIKRLKGGGIILAAARHNRRVIQTEMGGSGSIDPTRSFLNETLLGPPSAQDVAQLAKDRMRYAGITKLRKDAVMGLEFVFSLPIAHGLNDHAYFADCVDWVAHQFGGRENILSADVHRDEPNPHCHILLLPLIAGRMVGSDLMGGKKKLQAHQKDFHDAVASRHGLRKAPDRLTHQQKASCAQAVIQWLRNSRDSAMASALWTQFREAIERDPAPAMLALGINPPTPPKQKKTMAQIFTSPGKGPRQENPIGFELNGQGRTLCSVGFASEHSSPEANT
jgi:hypothetical protein